MKKLFNCFCILMAVFLMTGCAGGLKLFETEDPYEVLQQAEKAQAASKVSDLTAATETADDDIVPGVDVSDTSMASSGTTKKWTFSTIWTWISSKLTTAGILPEAKVADGWSDDDTKGATMALIEDEYGDPNAADGDRRVEVTDNPSGRTPAAGEYSFYADAGTLKMAENGVEVTPLMEEDVDDTPVDGATTDPVSSNWAYDHANAADPHTGYLLESALGTGVETALGTEAGTSGGFALYSQLGGSATWSQDDTADTVSPPNGYSILLKDSSGDPQLAVLKDSQGTTFLEETTPGVINALFDTVYIETTGHKIERDGDDLKFTDPNNTSGVTLSELASVTTLDDSGTDSVVATAGTNTPTLYPLATAAEDSDVKVATAGAVYDIAAETIAWSIKKSSEATAVADGEWSMVVPTGSPLVGMELQNLGVHVDDPNGATGGALTVVARRVRVGSRMGDDTSQFDLTDQTGDTARYTWDGTGTDPGISTSTLSAGDFVDISGMTTAANNGHFEITAVGTNYFEITNADLSAEADQTSVTITPIRHRDMTSTGTTVSYTEYYAEDETVDTANDELAVGDVIFLDITAVTTGAAQKGCSGALVFR